MSYLKQISVLFWLLIITGCASSKMSVIPSVMSHNQQPIKTIAIPSGVGVLGDAIAVELSNQGYQVFDSQQLSNLLIRSGLSEAEISQPQNLHALKGLGLDAYLSIRSAEGYDGLPESASVRLTSTSDGMIISGISWQNGWGGQRGSPCDRTMRKNIADAASEITSGLLQGMR